MFVDSSHSELKTYEYKYYNCYCNIVFILKLFRKFSNAVKPMLERNDWSMKNKTLLYNLNSILFVAINCESPNCSVFGVFQKNRDNLHICSETFRKLNIYVAVIK